MSNEKARNQHFLPQSYLKGFTKGGSKKSKLYFIDLQRREQFTTIPRNVGAARDFNRVEVDGLDPNVIESSLSPFENEVARVINWMDEEERIPEGEDLSILLTFIALLGVRNPAIREQMEGFFADAELKMLDLLVSDRDLWEGLVAKMKAEGYDGPDVPYEKMQSFVLERQFELRPRPGYLLTMELGSIEPLLPYLAARGWVLFVARRNAQPEAGDFICSDRPVAILPTRPGMAGMPMGFGVPGTQLTIPLNKRLALAGFFGKENEVIPSDYFTVAAVNHATLSVATRFVYSPRRTFRFWGPNRPILTSDALL